VRNLRLSFAISGLRRNVIAMIAHHLHMKKRKRRETRIGTGIRIKTRTKARAKTIERRAR
jgi:hypothetical protein